MNKLSLVLLVVVSSCASSPLASVADKVPTKLLCPKEDPEAATALLERFFKSPASVEAELTERVKQDPIGVTCTLIDVRTVLVKTGQRETEAYKQVVNALRVLGAD